MQLTTVDHITINVANLDAAIAWYQTSFSCELLQRNSTLAVLKFNNLNVTLALPSSERAHVAYLKSNAAEFGELTPNFEGNSSTYLADPTGNIVELVEKV